MDDQRVGRLLRAIRHSKGWRQEDVGKRAGISQDVVSLIEIGSIDQLTLGTLRKSLSRWAPRSC